MKEYKLSTGAIITDKSINENGDGYDVQVNWFGKEIPTGFTPADDDFEELDAAIATFENVYSKREYYYMLARHLLKIDHLKELLESNEYEAYVTDTEMRNNPSLGKYGIFEEYLAEVELSFVIFGNEDEVLFGFYDYSRDQYYHVIGTGADGFFKIEDNDDDWDDDE